MIYTCTLNPCIDYEIWIDHFVEGDVARTSKTSFDPGGKGIDVSLVLHNIGIDSVVLGFVGGFTGKYFYEQLDQHEHLHLDFVNILGLTRMNVIIQAQIESRISANGPEITDEEYEQLISKVRQVKQGDCFVLSGSIPTSIKKDIYGEIAKIVKENGAELIVDTTKELVHLLKYEPLMIKPNRIELEEIFQASLKTDEEIVKHARMLQEKGAQNVLVSLSADGAMLVTEDKVYKANAINDPVVNTVGAGDSMVAGFVAHYFKTKDFQEALRYASACGNATAFSIRLADQEKIEDCYRRIEVKELDI